MQDDYIPLRDIVFEKLREAIITGQLLPGTRLMEISLAESMGVSRTPVREAIRKLQAEGLVIMNARRGAVVAPINKRDLKEILEIRKALESLACRLTARKVTEDSLIQLKDINNVMKNAVAEKDIGLIAAKDVEFHEMITDLADNRQLSRMLDQIKEHLYRYRREFIKELKDRRVLVSEHDKIIAALEAHNEKTAVRELEKHIELQERYILNTLENIK